ncbi:hypothetical protein GCM10010307_84910 [Streptomyces vastus]|uniref:Uncharacterized protein n=1 Tax=Streptomyces vastus TaxID=285451 RepID=A0ABP6EAJ6_9ACTN
MDSEAPSPSPEPDDVQADSVTRPSPTATATNFLVVLTGSLLGMTRRDAALPGTLGELPRLPGRAQQLARVKTELPTQNDLGEVQRVCGRAALSALWRSPVGFCRYEGVYEGQSTA